jgi:hypothetical protein
MREEKCIPRGTRPALPQSQVFLERAAKPYKASKVRHTSRLNGDEGLSLQLDEQIRSTMSGSHASVTYKCRGEPHNKAEERVSPHATISTVINTTPQHLLHYGFFTSARDARHSPH